MKTLHISLSVAAITLLLAGCGPEDFTKDTNTTTNTTPTQATPVENNQTQQAPQNSFLEIAQYKTQTQMQQEYPNAYALAHDFNFDINSVTDMEILKENLKAKIEYLYIEYLQGADINPELSTALAQKRSALSLRIINGTKAKLDDVTWNFIVSLQEDNQHFCGGSLIAQQWVLTAAHCLSNEEGQPSQTLPIVLTKTYSLQEGGERYESDAIYIHPLYGSSGGEDGDIALLHLKTPVPNAKTVALSHTTPPAQTLSKVAGWGNMSTTSVVETPDLMEVVLPIIDHDTCKNSYATENAIISDGMLCAGYMDGSKDSCQGDSGGPLIVNDNGRNLLAGVVSFGGSQAQSCGAPNFPGVYTSVSTYANWIEGYLEGNVTTTPTTPSTPTTPPPVVDENQTQEPQEPYENDFTFVKEDLAPLLSEIDAAQSPADLERILNEFLSWLYGDF